VLTVADDIQEGNGPCRHGFPLDWLSDPALPLWWRPSVQFVLTKADK
jgi:hypothetical protein